MTSAVMLDLDQASGSGRDSHHQLGLPATNKGEALIPEMGDNDMLDLIQLQEEDQPNQPLRQRREALNDFFALLVQQRQRQGFRRLIRRADVREEPPSHESLIACLQEQQLISSPRLLAAMTMVKRVDFVPPEHQGEAFLDSPIRVHGLQFSISAPHIHARALDTLDLQPGEQFLDVGTGTGLMAVYASILVGKAGSVLSIDVKDACIQLSKGYLFKMKDGNEEYLRAACEIIYKMGDVFVPRSDFEGNFDKVYIGAACPSDRLFYLTTLLRAGGSMVAPSGSEFLFIKKRHDGSLSRACLSAVSFTPLDVPSDETIVTAIMNEETRRIKDVSIPALTLDEDIDVALANSPASKDPARKIESQRPLLKKHKSEVHLPLTPLALTPTTTAHNKVSMHSWLLSRAALKLGLPDFTLIHRGIAYPAHRELLRLRGQCFHALFGSGMKDAELCTMTVQETFNPASLESFLIWIYSDQLTLITHGQEKHSFGMGNAAAAANEADVEWRAKEVTDLAMVSQFFGANGLVALCERKLADQLDQTGDSCIGSSLAPRLLTIAMAMGLRGLQSNALEYIVEHYERVEGGPEWGGLDREAVGLISRHLARRLQSLRRAVRVAGGMRCEMPVAEGADEAGI